jgi:hypothetical protein
VIRASLTSVILADLERRLAARRAELDLTAKTHLDGRRAAVLGK